MTVCVSGPGCWASVEWSASIVAMKNLLGIVVCNVGFSDQVVPMNTAEPSLEVSQQRVQSRLHLLCKFRVEVNDEGGHQ